MLINTFQKWALYKIDQAEKNILWFGKIFDILPLATAFLQTNNDTRQDSQSVRGGSLILGCFKVQRHRFEAGI